MPCGYSGKLARLIQVSMKMNKEIPNRVRSILDTFDPDSPILTADSLRKFWMTFEPKSIGGIKAELGEQ